MLKGYTKEEKSWMMYDWANSAHSVIVVTLLPIFFIFTIIEIPAMLFLGLWFIYQLQSGAASLGMAGSGIAWWAHVGGFLAGVLMNQFLIKRN